MRMRMIWRVVSPCLCLPPASTVWHWAQALVKIAFPAAALMVDSAIRGLATSAYNNSTPINKVAHCIRTGAC